MTNESLIKIWRDLCAEESRLQSEIATLNEHLNQVKAQLQTVMKAKSELERQLPTSFQSQKPATTLSETFKKFARLNGFFVKTVKVIEE
ncbi:MAG: hypothetical protein SNJ55_12365 [Chloroherpetonaceae bacterium]